MSRTSRIFAAVIAVAVVFGGLTTYAYASDSVVIGNPIYGLKTAIEAVQVGLAQEGSDAVATHLSLANRRIEEAKHIAATTVAAGITTAISQADLSNASYTLFATVNNGLSEVQKALQASENVFSPEQLQQALASVENTQVAHIQDLLAMAEQLGIDNEEVSDTLLSAIDVAHQNLESAVAAMEYVNENIRKHQGQIALDLDRIDEEIQKTPLTAEEVQQLLAEFSASKDEVITRLTEIVGNQQDAEKLMARLEKKAEKIAKALADGNIAKAQGEIRSLVALTNNAKHFTRRVNGANVAPTQVVQQLNILSQRLRPEAEQLRTEIRTELQQRGISVPAEIDEVFVSIFGETAPVRAQKHRERSR